MTTYRFSGNQTAVINHIKTMHSNQTIYLILIFANVKFLEFGVFIILLCYKINKVVTN